MARPKKTKEEIKAAVEVAVHDVIEGETEVQAEKIEHAIEALAETMFEEEVVQGDKYVGKHPVTGEAMYI